jgi:hypothetical protein
MDGSQSEKNTHADIKLSIRNPDLILSETARAISPPPISRIRDGLELPKPQLIRGTAMTFQDAENLNKLLQKNNHKSDDVEIVNPAKKPKK